MEMKKRGRGGDEGRATGVRVEAGESRASPANLVICSKFTLSL